MNPAAQSLCIFASFDEQVLDETVEEKSATERLDIGMVVIRGNCIIQFECLDRV